MVFQLYIPPNANKINWNTGPRGFGGYMGSDLITLLALCSYMNQFGYLHSSWKSVFLYALA